MKLSKSSWHYKMNREIWDSLKYRQTSSLCIYFWQTVLSICLLFFMLVMCIMILFFVLSPYINFIDYLFNFDLNLDNTYVVIGYVFNFFIGLIIINATIRNCNLFKRKSKMSKPNLVTEYIKAKKDKICPIIEFEE